MLQRPTYVLRLHLTKSYLLIYLFSTGKKVGSQ
jgi:hypothetical protein